MQWTKVTWLITCYLRNTGLYHCLSNMQLTFEKVSDEHNQTH